MGNYMLTDFEVTATPKAKSGFRKHLLASAFMASALLGVMAGVLSTGGVVKSAVAADESWMQSMMERFHNAKSSMMSDENYNEHHQHKMGGGKSNMMLQIFKTDLVAADANKDGYLDAPELKSSLASIFKHFDADKSGEITPKEMRDGMSMMMFKQFDSNGDGSINSSEFSQTITDHIQQNSMMMGEHHGFGDKQHDPSKLISRLDKDGNGTLSLDELNPLADLLLSHLGDGSKGLKIPS